MSTRAPVSTGCLLLPIRSPVIWGSGALIQKISFRKAMRNDKIDHPRTSGQETVSGSRLRAVSAPVDADARGPQLATDHVRAILFDMDGVLCNSEEMTQRWLSMLHELCYQGVVLTLQKLTPYEAVLVRTQGRCRNTVESIRCRS